MLLISKDNDKKDIMAIYNTVFSGERDFAERFFNTVWKSENCLSIKENGQTVSAVNVLPFTLTDGKTEFSAGYIYAAMTLPMYRGNGFMAKLLCEAFEMNYDFSILIVQNNSLFDYYSKFGYLPFCTVSERIVSAKKSADFTVRKADVYDYEPILEIYEKNTNRFLSVKRNPEELNRISAVYNLPFYVAVKNEKVTSYCIGYKEENRFFAAEAAGDDADELSSVLAGINGCESAIMRTIGSDKPIGMIKPLNGKAKKYLDSNSKIYINLLYN